MSELKKKTVRELRELARRHVGAGHSKLKTKKQLVAALERAMAKTPGVRKSGQTRQREVARDRAKSKQTRPPGARPRKTAPWAKQASLVARQAPDVAKQAPDVVKQAPDVVKQAPDVAKQAPDVVVIDGFFLKRGNAVPWAHPEQLPPVPRAPQVEKLARPEPSPLPRQYPLDRMVLLARDPTTLFLFWDFRLDGQNGGRGGTASSRWMMRLFDEGGAVRDVEFNPERGSLYFYNLKSGRHYRAEAYVIGSDGKARRWAKATRSVELPSDKPLAQGPVRMLRLSWQSPVEPKVEQRQRAEVQTLPSNVADTIRRRFSVQTSSTVGSSPQRAWGSLEGISPVSWGPTLRSGLAP